jgi:hypothetical protein
MLIKIILLPFTLVKKVLGLILGIVKLFFSTVFGVLRFIVSRVFGTAFGALIGFLLGSGHIGVRLWKRKKKKPEKSNE